MLTAAKLQSAGTPEARCVIDFPRAVAQNLSTEGGSERIGDNGIERDRQELQDHGEPTQGNLLSMRVSHIAPSLYDNR